MITFKDNIGRDWVMPPITALEVMRAKRDLGINIPGLLANGCETFNKLLDDVESSTMLVWQLVEKQAEERGIDMEEFLGSLGGDSLGAANAALIEAVIDFFPQAQARALFRQLKAANDTLSHNVLVALQNAMESVMKTMHGVDSFS